MNEPVQQVLATALTHHQAGRLAEAQTLYRQILQSDPQHPEAMHLLGVVLHQTGRSAEGVELIGRAVQIAPTFANLNNLGEALRRVGRVDEAIVCYRRSIELNPNAAEAWGNLGKLLAQMNRAEEAEKSLTRAAQLSPKRADYQLLLCDVRRKLGDPHGAVQAGRRAVELRPDWAEAWSSLAMALALGKKHAEALEAANRSVALAPMRAEAHVNLGFVHERAGRVREAELAYRRAIQIDPNSSVAYRNLAALCDLRGEVAGAIPLLQRALTLAPSDVEGWNNLSSLRRRMNDAAGALEAAERALALAPGHPAAHGNRGLALLTLGDYERGFAEYEWRWRCDNFTTAARDFGRPLWDGSDPSGRTIFVHTEQGYGDTIQFARYVPMLADRGAKVILECSVPLRTLMGSLRGVSRVVPTGVRPPDFDLHVPLLSLPRIFRTTLATVPNQVPYLGVDPSRQQAWQSRLAGAGPGLRVGLIWSGNVRPDPARTCPIEHLAPLWRVAGVSFVSLQKRDSDEPRPPLPDGMRIFDVGDQLHDFADTAAAMLSLDLILTIDTAAAHLAGALGRATWTMLPWAADWRWLLDRQDSPWYPTMRLFRQPGRGDWTSVILRIEQELRQLAAAGK